MPNAGQFEIHVWTGGWPIWCELKVEGEVVAKFSAIDLADLAHVVERARVAARMEARRVNQNNPDADAI